MNVDCSTILDGYFSDSSRMFCIGEVSPERKKLVDVTRESIQRGLAQVKPWNTLGDMAHAVQTYVEENGFNVVREFGGHGIGKEFHEDPFVSHVGEPGEGVVLAPGMCFTIEPMVNAGGADIDMNDPNGWTVRLRLGPVGGPARRDRYGLRAAELVACERSVFFRGAFRPGWEAPLFVWGAVGGWCPEGYAPSGAPSRRCSPSRDMRPGRGHRIRAR